MHDGSLNPPVYSVNVSDGRTWSSPQTAAIDFAFIPILENNQLVIDQGEIVTFTADNLRATYEGSADGDLSFLVSSTVHGHFESLVAPGRPITAFQQNNITGQNILLFTTILRVHPVIGLRPAMDELSVIRNLQPLILMRFQYWKRIN